MADYYHTSREHVKKLKSLQDNAARRAERRTELAGISAELPLNLLRVDARPAKVFRNAEQHRAIESMEGMLPWNGNHNCMIDRFDGRALLDFYKEPLPTKRKKTADEELLEELVALESYRDLVRLLQKGLDDAQGIRAAEQENIELRAQAKTAAAAAAGVPVSNTRPASSTPAGTGSYGAVGFAYDTGVGGEGASGSERGSSEEDSEDDDEEERPHLDDEALDNLAANLGIEGYSAMLRRVEKQEAEFAAGNVKRAKRMFSRKKAAQRAKRMAGQGLEAFPKSNFGTMGTTALAAATRDRVDRSREMDRRRSPSYDRHSSRSRSRSWSPGRRREDRPRTHYITSFSDSKSQKSSRYSEGSNPPKLQDPNPRLGSFLDALPSGIDPSIDGGPVALPAAAAIMHGRRAAGSDYRQRQSQRDNNPRGSSRHTEKEPARAQSTAKAAPVKESPMERLKRLRAAQLNKTFQKDVLSNAQKKANEERDRHARLQIERVAFEHRRSPSPSSRYGDRGSPVNQYSVSPDRRY